MKESTSKEKVLKNIREALVNSMAPPYESVDLESNVFAKQLDEFSEIAFAEAFSAAGGQFVYCGDFEELNLNLRALLEEKNLTRLFCGEEFLCDLMKDFEIPGINNCEVDDCDASITACEVLVARQGTIMMSSSQGGGRKPFMIPGVHIVIASARQLVHEINDAFSFLNKKYNGKLPGMVTFVTGPSRTTEIENTLVQGVHGPKEVILFLVETR